MRSALRTFSIAGCCVVVLLALAFWTAPARAGELESLWAQILRDPQNIELNMRYGRLAEERGEVRKALAAYERVIAVDPSHQEAANALHRIDISLIPTVTQTRVELGMRYETNPRQLPSGFNPPDDVAGFARLRIQDRRAAFDNDWRSDLHGYFDLHDDVNQIDFWRLRGHTGPAFDIFNNSTVHIGVGGSIAFLDAKYFYAEPSVRLRFENLLGGMIDRLDIRAAFRDIDNAYMSDDGFVLDVNARKTHRGIIGTADALLLQPFFRVRHAAGTGNGAGGGPANFLDGDYIEIGGRIGYYVLVNQDLRLGGLITAHYRDYEQAIRFGTAERYDWNLRPEAEIMFRNVVCGGCDIRLRYIYEENFSNDGTEDYLNHSVIASGVRRF